MTTPSTTLYPTQNPTPTTSADSHSDTSSNASTTSIGIDVILKNKEQEKIALINFKTVDNTVKKVFNDIKLIQRNIDEMPDGPNKADAQQSLDLFKNVSHVKELDKNADRTITRVGIYSILGVLLPVAYSKVEGKLSPELARSLGISTATATVGFLSPLIATIFSGWKSAHKLTQNDKQFVGTILSISTAAGTISHIRDNWSALTSLFSSQLTKAPSTEVNEKHGTQTIESVGQSVIESLKKPDFSINPKNFESKGDPVLPSELTETPSDPSLRDMFKAKVGIVEAALNPKGFIQNHVLPGISSLIRSSAVEAFVALTVGRNNHSI